MKTNVETGYSRPTDYTRCTLLVLGVAAAYRALIFAQFGPGPDESFYWLWSRRLDLGYVEHPPLIAYAMALMRVLVGEHPAAWRLLADAAAFGTGWCLFATGRALFTPRVGFWTAAAHAASPALSMAGGSILIPESLVAFWVSLGLYAAARLLLSGQLRWFFALGLISGAGLLTKMPALLIPFALGLFALLSPTHRHWLRRPQFYAMLLIAVVMLGPVIYWNAEHNWIGLRFVSERSEVKADDGLSALARFWGSLLGQAVYHSPILYGLLWFAAAVGVYRGIGQRDARWLLLSCFSVPVMLAFECVSAVRFTLPHWPLCAYLGTYVMLPAVLFEPGGVQGRVRQPLFMVAIIIGALCCITMPLLLLAPLTTRAYATLSRHTGALPQVIEPMAHVDGWREEIRAGILAEQRRLAGELGQTPVVLTHFHMLAAILTYALHPDSEVACVHAQAHQFDLWYDDDDLRDRPVLFVSSDAFLTSAGRAGRPEDYYRFDTCTPLPDITVARRGLTINTVHLWLCTGYRGPQPTPGPRI